MSRDARILSAIAVAILAAAVVLIVFLQMPNSGAAAIRSSAPVLPQGPVAAGKMAADFTLKTLDGRTIRLSALRGKVVFLNIWATWCGPCREEMPSIETMYEKFKGGKDFVVLAVSEDTGGAKPVAQFVAKYGYRFPILLDPENRVGDAYGVSGIPETFVIDRAGRIVAHHLGPYNWANGEIRDALQELINSKEG